AARSFAFLWLMFSRSLADKMIKFINDQALGPPMFLLEGKKVFASFENYQRVPKKGPNLLAYSLTFLPRELDLDMVVVKKVISA
ncbi:hypothetical protein, partial [Salmonella enterica]|uniref:hypothetical protein n=1 Tax=Salmonella enterica TaxID=28901 RepID=UPI00329A211A